MLFRISYEWPLASFRFKCRLQRGVQFLPCAFVTHTAYISDFGTLIAAANKKYTVPLKPNKTVFLKNTKCLEALCRGVRLLPNTATVLSLFIL